ncbi:MAG: HEAT repeat domain-containing protein, partial [Anaerolineae bacterium]
MALFGLFRPPDIAKLEASRDISGLAKAARGQQEWIMRRDALLALNRIGGPAVPPLLIQALHQDVYWKNREIAAELLGALNDQVAVEPLIVATRDAYIDVR